MKMQPDMLPDKYESGTANSIGIAGLGAGVRWVQSIGVESIRAREAELNEQLLSGLQNIPGITVYGPKRSCRKDSGCLLQAGGSKRIGGRLAIG